MSMSSPSRADKEGRDYIQEEGLVDDCMVRACMKVR